MSGENFNTRKTANVSPMAIRDAPTSLDNLVKRLPLLQTVANCQPPRPLSALGVQSLRTVRHDSLRGVDTREERKRQTSTKVSGKRFKNVKQQLSV